jgi:hypothetical protein
MDTHWFTTTFFALVTYSPSFPVVGILIVNPSGKTKKKRSFPVHSVSVKNDIENELFDVYQVTLMDVSLHFEQWKWIGLDMDQPFHQNGDDGVDSDYM